MRSILTIFLSLIASLLFAQSSCVQSLDKAKSFFAEGHLYEIPQMLDECLKRGFTREQKVQAYHLLSMTYLYLDRHEEAEKAYMQLLELEPEFDVENDNDKIEIVYLDSKFKTTPIFTFTGRAGLNRTMPFVIIDYPLDNDDPEQYKNKTGFWFGPGLDFSIDNNWKIGAEILYRKTNFFYESLRFGEDNVKVTHHQNWASLPVSVKYVRKTGPVHSYVYGGVMFDWMMVSSLDLEFVDIWVNESNIVEGLAPSRETLKSTDMMNRTSLNLIGGIGAKYRIDYYYVFFELRFIGGLKNLVREGNRYSIEKDPYLYDLKSVFEYIYVDDDYRLNNFGFSIGFENPFYKPRKITSKQPFFKRIFN